MRYSIEVKKIPIDKQGYDKKGRYWGIGQPLFYYTVFDEQVGDDIDSGEKRASSIKEIKTWLKSKYNEAKSNPSKLKSWIPCKAIKISNGRLLIKK